MDVPEAKARRSPGLMLKCTYEPPETAEGLTIATNALEAIVLRV